MNNSDTKGVCDRAQHNFIHVDITSIPIGAQNSGTLHPRQFTLYCTKCGLVRPL
jgi:hypothetical protein